MKTIKDGILGLAIGDAIGVPVEFKSREALDVAPVTDIRGFGTYGQPPGTWSDDSSLTFCLAEALLEEFSLKRIANNFILWKEEMIWTPHGNVFDIGIQTSKSIDILQEILDNNDDASLELLRYEADEYTNGNGSLMRILPLYYILKDSIIEEEFKRIWTVSALTHGHIRSAISCLIYLVLIDELIKGREKQKAYQKTRERITRFFVLRAISHREVEVFNRIIKNDVQLLTRNEIRSSGYVIHSLEASIWCFLHADTYKETILKAVNLGDDTDTTAAIAGGLAGVFYGFEAFPKNWYHSLSRLDDIEELCTSLELKYSTK
ncbi:ADP-ribosylglycohydrolase family protein [Spongiimicrobium salis]|uniref:ADP-ribosylglycohydrolase family protein n=1 Tax=Spongiimicrobium salis TaxID=1667022 RepID=UPI00374DC53B